MFQHEKGELYSIGEISEITGLPVTAIRFYSEKGLIVPSYIDENTGYRYFSSRHLWKLEIIKMYKQLGFSLGAIQELQQTRQLDVLERNIEKSEQSVREKMEEYQRTLVNLNWLKEQCDIFRQTDSEKGFATRPIPERRVLYRAAQPDSDIWDFAMLHQKKTTEELQKQKTIQRCYGFVLQKDFLQQGRLKIQGAYIHLDQYYSYRAEELKILPAGNYLCLRKTFVQLNGEEWMGEVQDRLKTLGTEPDTMILEEVSLSLLSLEDTVYELQIRIPN